MPVKQFENWVNQNGKNHTIRLYPNGLGSKTE